MGEEFTPLDVIGLSSVGLSTKTSKRTIGFMGIGFKAVYKRFHKVHISDGTFSFQFEKPYTVNASKAERDGGARSPKKSKSDVKSANNGWVMLPSWVEKSKESDGDRSSCVDSTFLGVLVELVQHRKIYGIFLLPVHLCSGELP